MIWPLTDWSPVSRAAAQVVVVGLVPVAFALGVLRGGFARTGEIDELGAWLGAAEASRPQLVEALAHTLGDDSLQLVFWVPDRGGYVDAAGAPVMLPPPGSGRSVVEIDRGGGRMGAIVYDAGLIADPELVRAAGRVVAIAVDHHRLTAQLLASQEALRLSRARIVEAGDRERRRIAQNLHDGIQVRLVLLGIEAQTMAVEQSASPSVQAAAISLRAGIDAAAGELRQLVYEVMPSALIERGLYAATEDLVDRMPVPTRLAVKVPDGVVPASVASTAYFVVAEGLTNAVKHAHAHRVDVRLAHERGCLVVEVDDDGVGGAVPGAGAGLRGLADRVDVLGGRLRIDSRDGRGTHLVAELPCES